VAATDLRPLYVLNLRMPIKTPAETYFASIY
jgi:hypothetical protein